MSEVNQCVLYAVLTANIDTDGSAGQILPTILKNINTLQQLLTKYSRCLIVYCCVQLSLSFCRSKSGQQYYLEGMEGLISKHPIYVEVLAKILHILYDKDVLSDESIITWYKKLGSVGSTQEPQASICSKLKPLIAWLEQSDSESEEDSD